MSHAPIGTRPGCAGQTRDPGSSPGQSIPAGDRRDIMAETGTQTPFDGIGWLTVAIFAVEVVVFGIMGIAGLFISTRIFAAGTTGGLASLAMLVIVPGAVLALTHRGIGYAKRRS